MPKYQVIVTREATESVVLEVVADNPEAADNAALAMAESPVNALDWKTDEGNSHAPYIGAPGEATELVKSEQLADAEGNPLWCEWTSFGPDKSLRWACNKPAIVEVEDADGLDFSYYCKKHKDTPPWNPESHELNA